MSILSVQATLAIRVQFLPGECVYTDADPDKKSSLGHFVTFPALVDTRQYTRQAEVWLAILINR